MSGSYIFYFHLVGFGLLSASIVGGWILNERFMSEKDLTLKTYVAGIMRTLWLLFLFAVVLSLITGIGSIFNLYYGTPQLWYQQGWLVIKIVLFGVLLVNGAVLGPLLTRRRSKLLTQWKNEAPSESDQKLFKELNKQVRWFFVVQMVLLFGILFFSAFGTSKHPGYF